MDIRLPQINAKTEAERQISSFLFQLVEQLQWALQNVDTSNASAIVTPQKSISPSHRSGESAESTFGSIKALIIKSADIVNAYYEEISNRLEGHYVAQSDFGIFEEQTSQDIFENSTNINVTYNQTQEVKTGVNSSLETLSEELGQVGSKVGELEGGLSTDVESLKKELKALSDSIQETTANIKSGLLYTNGETPVYGIEVGQTIKKDGVEVFNKFARFTADRLSFYDNNAVEVAYISDYRLYICDVEITGVYKIGGLVDTVLASGDVVEKWVGRG